MKNADHGFVREWRITEMEAWDADPIDMKAPRISESAWI